MALRVFEYDFGKAKDDALQSHKGGGALVLYMPESLVVHLERHASIPDSYRLSIVFRSGHVEEYEVGVFKLWEHGIERLVAEKLYMLLPLTVFSLRHELDRATKGNDKASITQAMEKILEATAKVADEAVRLRARNELSKEDQSKIMCATEYFFYYLNNRYCGIEKLNEEVATMIKTRYDTDYLPTIKELADAKAELEQKDKDLEQKDKDLELEKRTNAELLAEVMRLRKALGEA